MDELWINLQNFETQVKQNSSNSSKPPSSDGPSDCTPSKKTASHKNRGAQHGHKGHQWILVAENQVDHILSYFPPTECVCGSTVIADSGPQYRLQFFDVPISPHSVTEHQHYGGCLHTRLSFNARRSSMRMKPAINAITNSVGCGLQQVMMWSAL